MSLRPRSSTLDVITTVALVESARRAQKLEVTQMEERVFRAFNKSTDAIHAPVWMVMQSGSLAAVFVVAGDLARRGEPRRAATAAVAGTLAWGGVKKVKPLIGRGRPDQHLEDVLVRGQAQTGLGYPSGHSAVAFVLAMIASHECGPAARAAALTMAGTTAAARMYVGAHLPLDIAGGIAVGVLGGRAANFALVDRSRRHSNGDHGRTNRNPH